MKPKGAPAVHLKMPDGRALVCGATAKDAPFTWIANNTTCRSCRARLRRKPQLANAIEVARQVTVDEVVARGEP